MNRRKSKHKEKLNIAMFGQKRIPSREGGVEIVVEELCTRMVAQGHNVTCYNRGGHHVSGSEYDSKRLKEYKGIRLKTVPTIEKKGLAAVSSSFFAALCCAFGRYDIVHIHAEGPAFFAWLPKLFGKKVIVTIHGLDWQREKWKSGFGSKFIHQGEKNTVKYKLILLQGSKYVQSEIGDTYSQAKRDLIQGKVVLFSGTPCQIAGLKKYLKKEYNNLITIDIICHGVPSKRLFQDFIEFHGKKLGGKITEFYFRDKTKGQGMITRSVYVGEGHGFKEKVLMGGCTACLSVI